MKTKTKMLAMVEIAVVLCSVFLVALPSIAAEQNQAMEKASASEITTASEDDYVLGVYGNANEDDTIDMGDVVYTKLAIFGKKPKTELCDAKYDGRINVLDVIQTKLIILGKEKEITVVDTWDRIVTVKKPVKRVIPVGFWGPEAMRAIGAKDKIVGVSSYTATEEIYFPEISKLPSVGNSFNPDCEAILSLNPDLVFTWPGRVEKLDEKLPDTITVVALGFWNSVYIREEVIKLGYILDKQDETKDFFDDFYDKYYNLVKERTEGLSEEEKPKVYMERVGDYHTHGSGSHIAMHISIAGGRNIFTDVPRGGKIDPEAVVARNPDIIYKAMKTMPTSNIACGYSVDDPAEAAEEWNKLMNRPELANVSAVKNHKVYLMYGSLFSSISAPTGIVYLAKWFHPELFEDLDPAAIHQEYLTRFQHLDYDVYEHGVFVYHPEEHPDGH